MSTSFSPSIQALWVSNKSGKPVINEKGITLDLLRQFLDKNQRNNLYFNYGEAQPAVGSILSLWLNDFDERVFVYITEGAPLPIAGLSSGTIVEPPIQVRYYTLHQASRFPSSFVNLEVVVDLKAEEVKKKLTQSVFPQVFFVPGSSCNRPNDLFIQPHMMVQINTADKQRLFGKIDVDGFVKEGDFCTFHLSLNKNPYDCR